MSWLCCACPMRGRSEQWDREAVREIPYPDPNQPSMASSSGASAPPLPSGGNVHNAPGPLGCRYDDSLSELEVQLVCPGIREKRLMRAANADVHLKYDSTSMNVTVEINDVDKKSKSKTVVDRRYFEVDKFPGEISNVDFKLKKDCVVLTVKKKTPASWGNVIGQHGF